MTRVIYRGTSGRLVAEGHVLERDGAPVDLPDKLLERLDRDPTIQLERVEEAELSARNDDPAEEVH